MQKVSVVILNYNRKEDVLKTIASIYSTNADYSNFEIVLVDQNSVDGSSKAISERFPKVKLFCSDVNLGVAGGRNKGAELAKGDILVFIDDDAHFQTVDSLKSIEEFFESDLEIGVSGFKIVDTKNQVRDWQYHYFSLKHADKSFYSQQFVGCGHAIRTELFKQLGGYSPQLFFWGEEIEFCLKVYRDTNFKIVYWPEVVVVHRVSPISRFHWRTTRTSYKTRNRFGILFNYFPKNSPYFYLFFTYFFVGYFIRSIQNFSFKFFIQGFQESFSLKLTENRLSVEQSAKYSKCYLRQFFGNPDFYKGPYVSLRK